MLTGLKKAVRRTIACVVIAVLFMVGYKFVFEYMTMQRIIRNLKAESRIAEVLVVESSLDEYTRKYTTTIKFLEYDVHGRALKPKYFTFKGNQIQFQTLVVRFDDKYIEEGHRLKGKSLYLFLKAFVLDGKNTQEFLITPVQELTKEPLRPGFLDRLFGSKKGGENKPEIVVPEGYRVGDPPNYFEKEVWEKFWTYALDTEARKGVGIKNAQIEAPGSVFIPGTIYTLVIEHDGGVRIDTRPIPEILKKDA